MRKTLLIASLILGMTACNNDNDDATKQDEVSFRNLEIFSSTENNSTQIGASKIVNTWQELEDLAGREVADHYKEQGDINFDHQQLILTKMLYYREPLINQSLSLQGDRLHYSLEIDKGKDSKPIGVFWTGVVFDQLKTNQLQANIRVLPNNTTPYGMWSMEKIVDLNTSEMRLPKDWYGDPSDKALYFLKLKESRDIEAKNLSNTMNGSYEHYPSLNLIYIKEGGLVTTKVNESALGDGIFYHKNLSNSLLYRVEDGKLYLFFDEASKCFIFKRYE